MFGDELGLSLKGACASTEGGQEGQKQREEDERSVPRAEGRRGQGGGEDSPRGRRRARAATWMWFNEEQL